MSEIEVGEGESGAVRLDITKVLSTRLAVVANSGQGKSWLLRRIAEQFHGKIPVWIIDGGKTAHVGEKIGLVRLNLEVNEYEF